MLDSRKIARIVANRLTIRGGRTIQVAAVYRTAYGGNTAVTISIILKQQGTAQPAVLDQTSVVANEYLAELDLAIDPRPIAYIALTPNGATDDASIAAAVLLEILEYRQSGLIANRWQLSLRRLR